MSSAQVYNALPAVEVADEKLAAMGRLATLMPLCETILKHNLEETVGIRLLHNHNEIADDELMLELEEVDRDETYCLSTLAVGKTSCSATPYPNSWLLRSGIPVPLEYSLDPLVVAESDEVASKKDFFKEFQEDLDRLNVADLLGLCVLKRRFYEERKPAGGQEVVLVETTDVKRRANVLKFYSDGRFNMENLIQTVWVAVREEATPTVAQTCKPFCAPVAVIHCESSSEGHTSTTTNSHSVGHETTN